MSDPLGPTPSLLPVWWVCGVGPGGSDTSIVLVVEVGKYEILRETVNHLYDSGIYCHGLCYPVVPEGEAIPVSRVTLGNVLLEPVKASALIVVTDTLLRDVSAGGQSLFNRELAGAISDAVTAS